MSRTLYVGGDESNHGGKKREHYVAIYTAAFSYEANDTRLVEIPPGRTSQQKKSISEWLMEGNGNLRDFRFALVHYDYGISRRKTITLMDILPKITRRFIKGKRSQIERIVFHVDGVLNDEQRGRLAKSVEGAEVEVYEHPKVIPTSGDVKHPRIVEVADVLSHIAFRELSRGRESAEKIVDSTKRVKLCPRWFKGDLRKIMAENEEKIEHFLDSLDYTPLTDFF
ncbi:hypothetical protein J4447_01560 [Candidatus Pacearchaeota archaeon]|nr:hypothetical protein [Candidatus Pacearchaeota archaeon]